MGQLCLRVKARVFHLIPITPPLEVTRGNIFMLKRYLLCKRIYLLKAIHFLKMSFDFLYGYFLFRRDSYTYEKWMNKLSSSGWLSHVKDILTCGCLVAQCIERVSCLQFLYFQLQTKTL